MFKKKELKLFAHNVPNSCTNQCNKCGKDFDAKIIMQETYKDCTKEIKKLEKKLKKRLPREIIIRSW